MKKHMRKRNFRFFGKVQDKSVRLQLFIQLLVIVFFMVTFLLVINSTFIESLFYTRTRNELAGVVTQIDSIDRHSGKFYDQVKEIEKDDTLFIEIYREKDDLLIYSTAINSFRKHFSVEQNQDKKFFFDFVQMKQLDDLRQVDEDEKGKFYVGKEVPDGTEYVAYQSYLDSGEKINVYTQLDLVRSNARYASSLLRSTMLIIGISLMIVFFVYSRRFTEPLVEMNEVTKHVAKMDFSKKCVIKSINELGQLADNINSMSDSLSKAMGDLQEKNRQLELDIEHEHKLEKSRKEFVSNVSHELKTPIAIIQGYAEGLKLGISDNPEDNEEYIDVIIEEAKRMNTLVLDLLELSYYESGTYKLEMEKFCVNDMIDEYISAQKMIINDKNIDVEIDLPSDIYGFADEQKMRMVLNNYFSNAISHCEGEEKKIIVSAQETDSVYRISVFNSGKNIPEDTIEEMWNNFFRGDKSHRRDEGRFGIGLSIVSAIQRMHSMKFGCDNKENGVEFWFDVKKVVNDLSI